MRYRFGFALVAVSLLQASAVMAGPRCHVPLADWQPREVLLEKLRAMGWTITRIKTDDGCYKVYGTSETGERIEAKFDPATLAIIQRKKHND